MEDKLGLMVEMMRDIKTDIKDLENQVHILSNKVVAHASTHESIKEIEEKVEELDKFRSKVKGVGAAVTFLNAAFIGYFKSKGA